MKILYICTGNSFRSPVAETLTKSYSRIHEAKSAGIEPAEKVSKKARDLLEKENVEAFMKSKPEMVEREMIENSDLIIVMEDLHEEYIMDKFVIEENKIIKWSIRDPIDPEVSSRDVFDQLKRKVKELDKISELVPSESKIPK